jgi:hypothetical protein
MFVCDRNHSCCDFQYWDGWEDVEEEAKECGHLIEVVPVVHGRWIDAPYIYYGAKRYVCDNCSDDEYWTKRFICVREKFCPNCGADMRGNSNE